PRVPAAAARPQPTRRHADEVAHPDDRAMRAVRVVLILGGAGIMIYAVAGPGAHAPFSTLQDVVPWLFGVDLAHDLVLAPLVFAVAAVGLSRVRPPYRAIAQVAAFATGVLGLFAYPLLRGYGRAADMPG